MAYQPKGNNGGARPGAGRKPKRTKNATAIEKAEGQIRDKLPELIDNLFQLANGGYERVDEEWQPAGLVTVGSGEYETKAFPQLADDELVLVKRKVSIADRDRAANIYLADRIMGKPLQKIAPTDPSGEKPYEPDLFTNETAIDRIAAIFDGARSRRDRAVDGPDRSTDLDSAAGAADLGVQ